MYIKFISAKKSLSHISLFLQYSGSGPQNRLYPQAPTMLHYLSMPPLQSRPTCPSSPLEKSSPRLSATPLLHRPKKQSSGAQQNLVRPITPNLYAAVSAHSLKAAGPVTTLKQNPPKKAAHKGPSRLVRLAGLNGSQLASK